MKLQLLNTGRLDDFVAVQPHSQFLQSSDWGEFQKKIGRQVWQFGVVDDNQKFIAAAQIIEHKLPLKKSYLYCPRGPVVDSQLSDEKKLQALKLIFSKMRDITIETSQTEEIFFRFETIFNLQSSVFNLKKSKPIQPADTLLLNLTQAEEQLLEQMHQKTRYNIRLAEKHGVVIKGENDFAKAWPLFEQTSKRDKFNLHSKNYYERMLETVPWIKLRAAEYKGEIIAVNLISYFGDTATYLHGASDYNQRSLMAPYLLQWEVIKNAKEKNFKLYDFHGIAPADDKNHPWHGITRFKKGFGGTKVNYPGTFDFIYEPLSYRLYKSFRKINLLIRKLVISN